MTTPQTHRAQAAPTGEMWSVKNERATPNTLLLAKSPTLKANLPFKDYSNYRLLFLQLAISVPQLSPSVLADEEVS